MITVCNRRAMPKGIKLGSKVVYVGRGTPLGNPYRIGVDGNRYQVIKYFRKWLWREIHTEHSDARAMMKSLVEFLKQGVDLYLQCSCSPEACHADIIKRALEWRMSKEPPKKQYVESPKFGRVLCEIRKVPFKNGNGFHVGAYRADDGRFVKWVSHK